MPPSLVADTLDPGVSHLMSPTQLTPWRQDDGRRFIQKQLEMEKPSGDVEQAHEKDKRTHEATPPDDAKPLDVPVQDRNLVGFVTSPTSWSFRPLSLCRGVNNTHGLASRSSRI